MRTLRLAASLLLLVPVWLLVSAVLLINDVVYSVWIAAWRRRRPAVGGANATGKPANASIIVLNWNGREVLEPCLRSVREAVRQDGGNHEVIVVDNGSSDGSAELVRRAFPEMKLLALPENCYFARGNNLGAKLAANPIVVFLNNDMVVEPDFLAPLLEPFRSGSDVFAVTAQVFFPDEGKRREETGKTRACWRGGRMKFWHEQPEPLDWQIRHGPAFWMGGGSSAVDREKFEQLGGFDELFSPFYVEDADLSYQAWRRGWRILFSAESRVLHKHRHSTGRQDPAVLERIIHRNRLLFVWKNVTQPWWLLQHLAMLPLNLLRGTGQLPAAEALRAFYAAALKLPQALCRRNRCRRHYRRSDRQVFRIANDAFEYKQRCVPARRVRAGERLRILFVCPYLPGPFHGGGVRMLEMIRRLARHHEVSVLSLIDTEEERRYVSELSRVCKRLVVVPRCRWRDGPNSMRPLPQTMEEDFGDPLFGQTLRRMLIEEDYDVVQCEYIQIAHWVGPVRREVTVLTEHEVQHVAVWRRLQRTDGIGRKLCLLRNWLLWLDVEVHLTRNFDRVVALTGQDARSLQRFAPKLPIAVVPTCVDVEYFGPDHSEVEPDSVVFTGSFRHSPNVDAARYLVEEILPKVRARVPGARVYLVGSYPPVELQRLAGENVILTGWVDDLRPYLRRASLFVAPLRLGAGIRGKILEAWATGKPVAATAVATAGLGARHGQTAWIAETAEGLAEGIVTLLRDAGLREKMGRQARAWVEENFNWERAVSRQLEIYFECLRKRGRLIDE